MISWNELTKEKKLVVVTFVFLFSVFAVTGVLMERTIAVTQYGGDMTRFDGALPVGYTELAAQSSDEKKLKAMVKGSIYETGSNMTVYGACFDGDGQLLPEADTEFTAWYPNGSIVVGPNASMDKIYDDFSGYNPNGTGRWKIHVTMGSTIGTYLTEMRCLYDGEWALAFGEWQNPEWVERIGNIDLETQNITSLINEFRNDSEQNFTSVLNKIDTIQSVSSSTGEELRELGEALRALDRNYWSLDEDNPFYVLGSGTHVFTATDMLSPQLIAAVSSDGYYVYWDGETWNEVNSSNTYNGVSLLPANQVYGWAVGDDGASPIYAVNGNNATTPSLPSGSPTTFTDVELFQDPLNPASNYYAFLLGDDGSVYESTSAGTNWTTIGTIAADSHGRLSQVVENYDTYAQPNGYMLIGGQGTQVFTYDGNTFTTYNVTGDVKDVSLLYADLGYVVTDTASTMDIYKWNGSAFTLEFQVNDSSITPTGVEVHSQDDVWVSTQNPGTFFHFDGRRWKYSAFGYSELVTVVINLGGGNASTVGVTDISMSDARHGYAVGGDGLILEYRSEENDRYDVIVDLLNNISADINTSQIALETALQNLTNITVEMNQTLINNQISINQTLNDVFTNLSTDLDALNQSTQLRFNELEVLINNMNFSIQLKLDNILNNVTYTNLYLETTLTPLLNDTYQNTLAILAQLGIIEQAVNETRTIANETRSIVNESATDIDELVNRSRRIRAWITQ